MNSYTKLNFKTTHDLEKISEDYVNRKDGISPAYYFYQVLGLNRYTLNNWKGATDPNKQLWLEIINHYKDKVIANLEQHLIDQAKDGKYMGGTIFLLKSWNRDRYLIERDIAREVQSNSLPQIKIDGFNDSDNKIVIEAEINEKDS